MINRIRKLFNNRISMEPQAGRDEDKRVQIATSALLIEMAMMDNEFSEEEHDRIVSVLKREFGLTGEEVDELLELAELELKENTDIWQITKLINENYTPEGKIRIMEMIWKIVYADGRLDKHEDYFVRKLTNVLGLRHREVIAAKLKVLDRS